MVRPDHDLDVAGLAEDVGRRRVVLRRDDHEREAVAPFLREREDLGGVLLRGVDEHGIGAGLPVLFPALEGLLEAVAGDERLDAGDDDEVLVALRFLHRADLAGVLVHVGEGLGRAADEAVRLREQLVLDADAGDAALLELHHEAARRVEVAVAGVAIEQDRHGGGVGHELDDLHHLGPARLVVVADAERRRDREAASPDAFEAGLLGDLRGQAVVSLHQEVEASALQHALEGRGLAGLRKWLNH